MIGFILSLIRQRRLREEYSILWIAGSIVLMVFTLWRDLLDILAGFLGIHYAPTTLLLVAIFFGVLMFLHLTVVVSKHADKNKTLTQEIALLRNKLEELEKQKTG